MIWNWQIFSSGYGYWLPTALQVLFILFELGLGFRSGFATFDRRELLASVGVGAAQKLAALVLGTAGFMRVLFFAYDHRVLDAHFSPWLMFVCAFVLVDFAQYASHIFSHYNRWGWATHVIHHTPERVNFSVGFRLGVPRLITLISIALIAVCWLAGMPPLLVLTCNSLNMLYQFFSHTELIPRLRWVEYVFCTPSTHRVHHGYNPEYLNRNFGAVFTIFDRLFGTFREEDYSIPIRYGLGRPVPKGLGPLLIFGWRELAVEILTGKKTGAR